MKDRLVRHCFRPGASLHLHPARLQKKAEYRGTGSRRCLHEEARYHICYQLTDAHILMAGHLRSGIPGNVEVLDSLLGWGNKRSTLLEVRV